MRGRAEVRFERRNGAVDVTLFEAGDDSQVLVDRFEQGAPEAGTAVNLLRPADIFLQPRMGIKAP